MDADTILTSRRYVEFTLQNRRELTINAGKY
jgi:hypothetical protein